MTRTGKKIEMLYMAWYAVFRSLPLAIKLSKYTRVQIVPPEVAMRVDTRTCMGPRFESKCSFEPSRAAAAEVGYSPTRR